MSETLTISAFIPASPLQVYAAWLDGEQHTEMTGGAAHSEPVVGASFDAWDGYIHGMNLELEPGRRIVQSWRSSQFPDDAPDSRLELLLEPEGEGTRVTLRHWDIPAGQAQDYEQGWHEHYFTPMREYFIRRGLTRVISADQSKPAEQWERPDDKEEVDDWSSESDHDVGWEAPVVEEPADDEAEEPADLAPEQPAQPRPATLQAERPFLEPPRPAAAPTPRPAPKPAARKEPAKARPASGKATKKAAPRSKAAAKAKKRPAAKSKKKPTARKKSTKTRRVSGGTKKKAAPKKKAATKARKKATPKKKAASNARKKPVLRKKTVAKKKPAGKKRR